MAGQFSEHAALLTYIRERWPTLSADMAEEYRQEALTRALGIRPSSSGQALVDDAKVELAKMAQEAVWQSKRLPSVSFESLSKEVADDSGTMPAPRRRVGARPPKGLIPCHGSKPGFEMIEIGTGVQPTEEARLCAFLLRTMVLENIEAKASVPPEVIAQSLQLFQQVFGHRPFDAWANVLINQVAAAKRATIAPREQARSPSILRRQTTITIVARDDPSKTQREVPVRTELLSMRGPLAILACYGDLGTGEGEQFVATVTALFDPPAVEYPQDARERAVMILQLTNKALDSLPVSCPLPGYANDVELIVWLEMRLGFQGGGGAHSVKTETLLELLLKPEHLAISIEQHGQRMIRNLTGEPGVLLTGAMRSLAARVRIKSRPARPLV